MRKFFINNEEIKGSCVSISGKDAHHIVDVLRLKEGTSVILSDGKLVYDAIIEKIIDNNKVNLIIENSQEQNVESPIDIILYQGMPKSDKMEFILQKNTEIGVKRFVPTLTEFSIVKLNDKNTVHKMNRWQKVVYEASKQSGRAVVPDVLMPIDFNNAVLESKNYDLSIIPYEKEMGTDIKDIEKLYKNIKNIAVFIGPEGGFSEKEIDLAKNNGISPITLGPRILRTETAAIVVCSLLQYIYGDLCLGGI